MTMIIPEYRDISEVLSHVSPPPGGLWLEFGVAKGETLRELVDHAIRAPEPVEIFGFDSFLGLPEDWKPGYPKGTFGPGGMYWYGQPPNVPGATLVHGWFADTLPNFNFSKPVTLVHIDCDLYSSTVTVLKHVGPHLIPGSLILFDEFTESAAVGGKDEKSALLESGLKFRYVCNSKVTVCIES
jgi:hypothetical protein